MLPVSMLVFLAATACTVVSVAWPIEARPVNRILGFQIQGRKLVLKFIDPLVPVPLVSEGHSP